MSINFNITSIKKRTIVDLRPLIILILLLLIIGITSNNAQFVQAAEPPPGYNQTCTEFKIKWKDPICPSEYEYNEKYQLVINWYNTTKFIKDTEKAVENLKKNNVDTTLIEKVTV